MPCNCESTSNLNPGQAFTWRSHACGRRVDEVIARWKPARYGEGRQRGVIANCVQLVAGVLDDLYHMEKPSDIPSLRRDTGLHDPESAERTVRAMIRAYYARSVVDGVIEPGDVIVTRAEPQADAADHDGHIAIASGTRQRIFHTTGETNACFTSLAALPPVLRIYRPAYKESWL